MDAADNISVITGGKLIAHLLSFSNDQIHGFPYCCLCCVNTPLIHEHLK
jgi:hypothetical protein